MAKDWERLQRVVANAVGGEIVRGSGSGLHDKGDVRTDRLLIECKFTIKDDMTVKEEWIERVRAQAAPDKIWALAQNAPRGR